MLVCILHSRRLGVIRKVVERQHNSRSSESVSKMALQYVLIFEVFKEDLLRDIGELSPNIGEVLVSLCYNGNISRLTVTLFEAKGIKSRESASGLYAKISLTQHTKLVKTKKTSTVTLLGCRSSFNESFNFKLPLELLDTASVSIQLMYAQPGYNKDQPAGRIVLGSFMFARGKGLDHWTEMLSKPKEQIQYWHAVSE